MPEAYIVDTGVFARWYVDQVGFEDARDIQSRFLGGEFALETADFVHFELAEVLRRKGYLAKLLTREDCLSASSDLYDLGVVTHATSAELMQMAVGLAIDRTMRVFDAILIAHALKRGLPVLTSDIRLCRAVAGVVTTRLLEGLTPSVGGSSQVA